MLSVFVLVRRALLNRFASLALRLVMGVVNGGVVALVGWACVQSWPVVRVGGFCGSSLSFARCCVLCASLLPLLGGCRVVLGGCSRFWMLGGWRLCDVTWQRRGDEADVVCHWAVCRGHGRHRWRGGCLLKKPSHNGVTLPSCSTRT